MSTGLTITGAAFEFVGLALVFYELAMIRSQEFGVLPPWTRAVGRFRRSLRWLLRPKAVEHIGRGGATAGGTMTADGIARPGLRPSATDKERIALLERYVDYIDRDLSELRRYIKERADAAVEEAARLGQELRDYIDTTEAERRETLKPSIRRQLAGAACVTIGLLLGLAGSLVSTNETQIVRVYEPVVQLVEPTPLAPPQQTDPALGRLIGPLPPLSAPKPVGP
ncbi:hypothetical protein [Conexibacter sp. CPCC 206217]|uniref:hypothetical protein n=1 Tax=Conexibacter sp. CPCC 206217 TaxID=3064574 RepID=UPI00271E3E84|nr:hypothetical protein [Conexibacter sp. CPCC 206217]MDO8208949.1 hypothetical protein [Conexibacter sp. CPCC 206217]